MGFRHQVEVVRRSRGNNVDDGDVVEWCDNDNDCWWVFVLREIQILFPKTQVHERMEW